MSRLAPLGSPSRVTIKRVMRTTYRLEWEYDGQDIQRDTTLKIMRANNERER